MEDLDKLKKEIEEIVYQIKAVEIEGSPTIVEYQTAIDKLHNLVRQREKKLLEEEFGHAWIDSVPYPGKEYCLNCALYRTKELSNE